jgi:hypothetical protein
LASVVYDWALAEKACGAKTISMRLTVKKIAQTQGEDQGSESFKNFWDIVASTERASLANLLLFVDDVDAGVLEEHRLITAKERGGCAKLLGIRESIIKNYGG